MKRLTQLFSLILVNARIIEKAASDFVSATIESRLVEIKGISTFTHRSVEVYVNGSLVHEVDCYYVSKEDMATISDLFLKCEAEFKNRQGASRYENAKWFKSYFPESEVTINNQPTAQVEYWKRMTNTH